MGPYAYGPERGIITARDTSAVALLAASAINVTAPEAALGAYTHWIYCHGLLFKK